MNILYVSNDNYAHLLGISLTSVCENNKNENILNFFVIDDGISDENRQKLEKTARKYEREIKFFIPEITLSLSKLGKWSIGILYRIFFQSIIGEVLKDDRILYLDCDTVVVDSLGELWQTDLDSCICAAVYECMGEKHRENILLETEFPYYNSGMLLIDVKKWREYDIEKKCQKIIEKNSDTKMEYPDEGLLNNVLQGKIKAVNPRYNLTTIKCVFTYEQLKVYRKSQYMYSKDEYIEANGNPCIIHYTNNFLVSRPWFSAKEYEHPFARCFWQYKKESEWNSIYLYEENVGIAKKMMRKFFATNEKICVIVAGFIYEYIKPIKYDKLIV